MKLYVANCTKNFAVLGYRLPEFKNALSQNVDSGYQIMVAKPDLNMPQIESFLEQMRTYGLILVEELGSVPKSVTIPWMASLEKPIKASKIEVALHHNDRAMREQGVSFRKAAAIATSNKIQEYAPHAAGTLEFTVQEESEGTTNASTGEPLVAEGIRVDRDAPLAR